MRFAGAPSAPYTDWMLLPAGAAASHSVAAHDEEILPSVVSANDVLRHASPRHQSSILPAAFVCTSRMLISPTKLALTTAAFGRMHEPYAVSAVPEFVVHVLVTALVCVVP